MSVFHGMFLKILKFKSIILYTVCPKGLMDMEFAFLSILNHDVLNYLFMHTRTSTYVGEIFKINF